MNISKHNTPIYIVVQILIVFVLLTRCSSDENTNMSQEEETTETGWTEYEVSDDSRIIYVSSSGSNDNDGLSPDTPKQNISAGITLMRANMPDRVLLKRGDTFSDNIANFTSGRSTTEPVMISSYGDAIAPPIVRHGVFFPASPAKQYVVISDLRFENSSIEAAGGNDILIEGCQFEGGPNGIVIANGTNPKRNWKIRRNTIYNTEDNAMYFSGIDNLLIEENIIYRPSVVNPGNHGIYISRGGNANVITRGNMVHVGKPMGNAIMQRPGGISEGNIVAHVRWAGIAFGACNDGGGSDCYDPVSATIINNIVINVSRGIELSNPYIAPNAIVRDNLVINSNSDGGQADVGIVIPSNAHNSIVENNILYNAWGMRINDSGASSGFTLRNNVIYESQHNVPIFSYSLAQASTNITAENNRFYSTVRDASQWFNLSNNTSFTAWQGISGETGSDAPINFTDASRSIATYNSDILGRSADIEDFFTEAIKQHKFNYRTTYTVEVLRDYLKAGFIISQ